MGGHGLRLAGPGDGMVTRSRVSTSERRGDAGIDQDRVLAVDREHAAGPAHRAKGVEQPPVVEPEVVDHECLGRGDAAVDDGRDLGDRIVGAAAHGEAWRDIDRGIAGRGRPPLAHPDDERAFRRRGRTGLRVVEREERRRATECRGDRVLEEPVGLGVGGDARVGVDIDDAGEDEQALGRDDFPRGRGGSRALVGRDHGFDHAAADEDIGRPRATSRDDGPAADDEVAHARTGNEPGNEPGLSAGTAGTARSGRRTQPRR